MHQLPAFLAAEKSLRADTANCITSATAKMCAALQESNINLAFSGSTCVFGIHIDKTMYVANIGDSRCVVCRESDNGPITVALTTDHKPDSPGEMERILAAGGRVCPIPGKSTPKISSFCVYSIELWLLTFLQFSH
jgi:serine/threonine protein phosphatase PrpC